MNASYFVFIGAKGGCGTSTICAELAKAMRGERSVTLVDADLGGKRSAGILFNCLRPLDAARDANGPIALSRTNGVTIAELTANFEAGFTISTEQVEALACAIDPGVVIVDAPLPFSASARPLMARASRFAVVLEPTLLGVAAARTMLANLRAFGVASERLALVINARGTERSASRSDIEGALGVAALGELPTSGDRSFLRAIESLAQTLRNVAPLPALQTLLPSSNDRVRDRRAVARAPVIAGEVVKPPSTAREQIKERIHEALAKDVDLLDASRAKGDAAKIAELRAGIDQIAQDVISAIQTSLSAEEIAQIKQEIVNESLGLGPLEDFMADPEVSEIMVNGPKHIYVERSGIIYPTHKQFDSDKQLRVIIERIVTPLGRRVDESSPMVDARLPDGSRVNAIVEPLSLDGATLTIRRFGKRRLTAQDLLAKDSACAQMLDFLQACVEARLNIVISGGTGSGKTTFLNILSGYLPQSERIVTIEDAAELLLDQPHVVRLESRPANIEGSGEVRIRDLVRNALRMRPDRIVVGECRGPEALDMLQAMNTGHDGSLTTIHANSARDALARIETMVLMAGFDLPVRAIREQVSSALDIVIHTARLRDGARKITSITEVVGMEGDIVTMQEILRFVQHGITEDRRVIGRFEYTGVQPKAVARFEEYGVPYDVRTLSTLPLGTVLW